MSSRSEQLVVPKGVMNLVMALAMLGCTRQAMVLDRPDTGTALDAGSPDAAANLPPPRLIAPLSTALATSRRPTFRWELAEGTDGARIEICADRACSSRLGTFDADGDHGRPLLPLPAGTIFWRAAGRAGAQTGPFVGSTRQLRIGLREAPIDTSWGTVLDVDGNGRADIAVGAPDARGGVGSVLVWAGGASFDPEAPRELPVPSESSLGACAFGHVASASDVNGGGFGDLVVASPGGPGCTGSSLTFLFYGHESGLMSEPREDRIIGPHGLGRAISAAGDVDGDGYADVIVGNPDVGQAVLQFGSASGFATRTAEMPTPRVLLAGGSSFGAAVAGGADVDGDGYAEVVVGEPDAGRAHLYRGGSREGVITRVLTLRGPPSSVGFGAVLAVGELDGDGATDVLVSAPATGEVFVYYGSTLATGATSDADVRLSLAGIGFGTTLTSGDVTGDGFGDVVVGAPLAGADRNGELHVHRGSSTGVRVDARTTWRGTAGMELGSSFAVVGDVDGDLADDIIIGVAGSTATGGARLYFGGEPPFFGADLLGIGGTP